MSQYNAASLFAADNAGQDATELELAPFLPTMDQSGDCSPPALAGAGQSIGSTAALPPKAEFASLHGKTESASHAPAPANPGHQLQQQHAPRSQHKAYNCTCGCQKGFTKLFALKRHIRESTQARESRCPLCDHTCKRVGHVEQHLRLVHKQSKDEIKRLQSTQRPEPRQEAQQSSTGPTAVPTTGSMVAQACYPVSVPGGSWVGPTGLYAPAHVEHPGARPGHFPAFFPLPATAQVTTSSAFMPQNFMVQTPGFPVYPHYPAYPVGASPAPTGFIANPVPGFSTYPVAPVDGTNNFFYVNPGPVSVNPSDGFGMSVGAEFTMDFSGLDFNTLGN